MRAPRAVYRYLKAQFPAQTMQTRGNRFIMVLNTANTEQLKGAELTSSMNIIDYVTPVPGYVVYNTHAINSEVRKTLIKIKFPRQAMQCSKRKLLTV